MKSINISSTYISSLIIQESEIQILFYTYKKMLRNQTWKMSYKYNILQVFEAIYIQFVCIRVLGIYPCWGCGDSEKCLHEIERQRLLEQLYTFLYGSCPNNAPTITMRHKDIISKKASKNHECYDHFSFQNSKERRTYLSLLTYLR